MDWTVTYYSERIKKEIFSLPAGILTSYRRLLAALEKHGADLRLPHSRAMGGGLFELRPGGAEGIGRVFYCTRKGQTIVMLHSFIKKTATTPSHELEIAISRMKKVKNG